MTTVEPTDTPRKKTRPPQDVAWIRTVVAVLVAELAGLIAYAAFERSIRTFACGLLVAIAAGAVGSLIGFIFGIPKSVTTSTPVTDDARVVTTKTEYQGNTNLEQISDWLAKLLVGAGLVELKDIGGALTRLGTTLGTAGCLGTCGAIVGPALVVGFSVTGFLLTYLWARIYLIDELRGAGH